MGLYPSYRRIDLQTVALEVNIRAMVLVDFVRQGLDLLFRIDLPSHDLVKAGQNLGDFKLLATLCCVYNFLDQGHLLLPISGAEMDTRSLDRCQLVIQARGEIDRG